MGGKLSRLVYLAPHPGFGSGSVIGQFLLHHNLRMFSCKRYKHYFSQTEMSISNVQFGYLCSRGWGQAAGLVYLAPPPAKDLGQAVSSVNSYGTIMLEYVVVRDIDIISVKLTCLHPMFSLVTFVRDMGGKLSRLIYLAPVQDLHVDQAVSSVSSCCTIILECLVVRDINIISVKLRCPYPTFSLVAFVRGVGG